MRTIRITGSALPGRIVTNKELEQMVETSDEWIRERTGIGERHVSVGETVVTLASEAARKALEQAGKRAEEIDLILVATCSPEQYLPCCACQVQAAVGAVNALAFDVNAACSGFLFALDTAKRYLDGKRYQKALVIGAEILSKIMDWEDRSTCVLFGDGAGAAVLSVCEGEEGIRSMVQGSDGARGMVLRCDNRPVNNPFQKNETGHSYVSMNGQEVYKFAVRTVPDAIEKAVEEAGFSMDEIDLFLLHQANYRIIEAVAKRLHQPMEKFPTNLQEYGNISAASIPILLDNVNNHGRIKQGNKIILAGFGAGLTWGATVLVW